MTFNTKIDQILQQLAPLISTILTSPDFQIVFSRPFSDFNLPSAEMSDLVCKSKPSTCQLDPLPTILFIHSSLIFGTVQSPLKSAAIIPILKKPGADPNNFNNLRPISNLPFLSKILERTVASQIHDNLSQYS